MRSTARSWPGTYPPRLIGCSAVRRIHAVNTLEEVAPEFITMAHSIVWCSAATVDASNRPRVRVLHPIWSWDGAELTGWIATGPTAAKRAHLAHSSQMACNYWSSTHDTCLAECEAAWRFDDETRT